MQSALIVYSKHTRNYARLVAKKYKAVSFLEVTEPPAEGILKIKSNKDIVMGVGGGSVIDTAKVISRDKRCIAIPTTASGAAMTPYATIWGEKKITIPTQKPILKIDYRAIGNLCKRVRQSTLFDAFSHAIESFWSKHATSRSKAYSKKAVYLLTKYLESGNIRTLILAGNLAGEAIAITKTNVIHAISYPITIKYGIDHGTVCGLLLPTLVDYMDFKGLPELFNLNSTKSLVALLKTLSTRSRIKNFNIKLVAGEAMKYDRINDSPKKISRDILGDILKSCNLTKVSPKTMKC